MKRLILFLIAFLAMPAAAQNSPCYWSGNFVNCFPAYGISANNFVEGYTTTATAAGTTVLTAGSSYLQFFTGATTQTVTMPVASTMQLGQGFQIVNNSSGVVTVQSSGGNTIQALSASSYIQIICILTSGTGTASWNSEYAVASTGTVTSVALTAPAIFTVTGSPVTTSGTLAIAATGTSGGIPYFNAATTLASSAALAANAVVIGGGAGATPTTITAGTADQVLVTPHAGGAPVMGQVDLSQTAAIKSSLLVANGGTGLASGTSGGVLAYTASGTLASSAALTANAVVIGGGAGVVPAVAANNATATNEFLTQSSNGVPAWAALLAADIPNHSAAKITSGTLAVAQGGTNLASGTSGGVLAYTASGTLASSAALTQYGIVYGGGAGVVPATTAACTTTTNVLHGGSPPSCSAIAAGDLPAIGQTTAGADSGAQTRLGTNTNDTAAAGNVGEMFTISRIRSSASSVSSGSTANVGTTTSITLTAGDWQVCAVVGFQPNGTAAPSELDAAVSATSATLPSGAAIGLPTSGEYWGITEGGGVVLGNGHDEQVEIPCYQVQVANAATKQLYLVASPTFTGAAATVSVYGWMQARRMR